MPLNCRTVKSKCVWIALAVMAAGLLFALIMTQTNTEGNIIAPGTKSYERLKGKWMRPDGGYIIEITHVTRDGKLDCSYFNPNPIHVSQAKASIEGENIKLFIELQDTGYPGCTYNLTYDVENNQLKGIYYQAAIRKSYEIIFNHI